MKKRNLTTLNINKKIISTFKQGEIKGGITWTADVCKITVKEEEAN